MKFHWIEEKYFFSKHKVNNYIKPRFCPNMKCRFFCPSVGGGVGVGVGGDRLGRSQKCDLGSFRYKREGIRHLKDGTVRVRFRCKQCGRIFSSSTFDLNYRMRRRGHVSSRIFFGVVHNRSNLSLSRELGVSEHCVRRRISRLAATGLMRHSEYLEGVSLEEELAYDGLEAFAYSQYEPCNINQVVGAESLFTYIFNYAPMNRKGRMSDRQVEYLRSKEREEGRHDPRAIRKATAEIIGELIRMRERVESGGGLVIRSDEHYQYRRALERDLEEAERGRIKHKTVNSRECRNYKNILFSVNHLDMLIRRKVAAFTRETICFSKKASSLMEKYILYICYKNYMRPAFTKQQKRDPESNVKSPAMRLGLEKRLLSFGEYFSGRYPEVGRVRMRLDWTETLKGECRYKRSPKFNRNKETIGNEIFA